MGLLLSNIMSCDYWMCSLSTPMFFSVYSIIPFLIIFSFSSQIFRRADKDGEFILCLGNMVRANVERHIHFSLSLM